MSCYLVYGGSCRSQIPQVKHEMSREKDSGCPLYLEERGYMQKSDLQKKHEKKTHADSGKNRKMLIKARAARTLRRTARKVKKADMLLVAGHGILWIAEITAVCLLAFVLVWFWGQRVSNAGDSMSPVLKNGDVVLVDRMAYKLFRPSRGDIIAFKPGGSENSHYTIKRIVGLPGETVRIVDGTVYINGNEQIKDIYVSGIQSAGLAEMPVELGEDEYFVMGDNHAGSIDSRSADMGNVMRDDIYGKVWFIAGGGRTFGLVKNQEEQE